MRVGDDDEEDKVGNRDKSIRKTVPKDVSELGRG